MSTRFKCPPDAFVKHDDFKLPGANKITTSVGGAGQKLEQKCNNLASRDAPSVLLRDDHIILLAIDALLALHASFKKWRKYRRTLRALAGLDERQLRDIGAVDAKGTRRDGLGLAPLSVDDRLWV